MLEDLGYVVVQAGSAGEALRSVGTGEAVDLVVTDFQMPGRNGVELARALRARRPDLPLLLITGFAQNMPALENGEDLPRLAKPFRQAEIADRVAALLEKR
jgi:CheY-like chemotaxis protein